MLIICMRLAFFVEKESIPTGPDHISQRGNYIRLMERVITEEIPYLSFCKDVVTSHIPPCHAKEMATKSEKVRVIVTCLPFTFSYWAICKFYFTILSINFSR